jgi:hypothetical protein
MVAPMVSSVEKERLAARKGLVAAARSHPANIHA